MRRTGALALIGIAIAATLWWMLGPAPNNEPAESQHLSASAGDSIEVVVPDEEGAEVVFGVDQEAVDTSIAVRERVQEHEGEGHDGGRNDRMQVVGADQYSSH